MRSFKKHDIIKIGKYKYVIFNLKKEDVELLPIDDMLTKDEIIEFIPKITIKKENIAHHQRLDNFEIFYLVNQSNPLIKKVVEGFLDSKHKKR